LARQGRVVSGAVPDADAALDHFANIGHLMAPLIATAG
jgi:hypothetical protein